MMITEKLSQLVDKIPFEMNQVVYEVVREGVFVNPMNRIERLTVCGATITTDTNGDKIHIKCKNDDGEKICIQYIEGNNALCTNEEDAIKRAEELDRIAKKVEEEEIATAGKRIHEFTGGDFSKTYELLCKCFDGKGCKGCPAVYSFVCKKSLMEEFKGLLDQNHTKQSGVIVYHIKNEDGMHCFPKKCANCGKSLGDHIVPDYCPHCGARLTDKDNMAIVVRWYD